MTKKRTPWAEKATEIKKQFPLSTEIDWYQVFTDDPAIMGAMINDILKLDQSRVGRPGKRPSLEESSTAEKMRKLQDVDYTERPFNEAFKSLCGDRSIRSVANKVSLDKSLVHRLLSGAAVPSVEVIENISKCFGKHPSYFIEYRIHFIVDSLKKKLLNSPESSIIFYNKITGK